MKFQLRYTIGHTSLIDHISWYTPASEWTESEWTEVETKRHIPVFLFLAMLIVPASAAVGVPADRPSILWIMLDDGRADALGSYGRSWALTPHMDRIAAAGVRFETAIVQNPVCIPSRTSMKASLYAHETGVMAMGQPAQTRGLYRKEVRAQYPSLLKRWSEADIQPENVGKLHAFKGDWLHRGDPPADLDSHGKPTEHLRLEWRDRLLSRVLTKTHEWMIGGLLDIPAPQLRTSRLGDRAVRRLRELTAAKQPFFLRVSFHAPHVACHISPSHYIDPTTIDLPLPVATELARKPRYERENIHIYGGAPDLSREEIQLARGTYYGMIRLVDDQVGRLLRVLEESNRLSDTIIVINSDQGFQLGEHGVWKKRDFYDSNVRVPFIMSAPNLLPAGKVVEQPVEMVDFLPTMLELSGFDPPEKIQGKSLLPLIRGEVQRWRPACFSEHDYSEDAYDELRKDGGRRVMVRTREWKLVFFMDERIQNADRSLYNLRTDPDEQHNLAGDPKYEATTEKLEEMARRWDRGT